jgi:hypothetical protein
MKLVVAMTMFVVVVSICKLDKVRLIIHRHVTTHVTNSNCDTICVIYVLEQAIATQLSIGRSSLVWILQTNRY